jgi:GTP-binding protein
MLEQTGAWQAHQTATERVMDNLQQEKERGITMAAKGFSVHYKDVKINITDTPGHSDFAGDTEASIRYLADGVLLLVDASEGVLPQSRHYLRVALQARKPIILVINKIDRTDARPAEIVDSVYELFLDLDATDDQIEFPIVYCIGREGKASIEPVPGEDLTPLFETILEHIPVFEYEEDHPLQALVTGLDADPYLGRIAVCRVMNGTIQKGQTVAWMHKDGVENKKVRELYLTEYLERVSVQSASAGEVIAIAGLDQVTIGDTIASSEDPRGLERVSIAEPNLGMTIGINTSPLAGKSGKKLTARQIKDRLEQELVGNVTIEVVEGDQTDTWEVRGRGELQLAVLVETMRREGFELTVGKPQVVTREIDGKTYEPVEHVVIDVPEDFLGIVTQLMALRKGTMRGMVNHGTGWVRLEFETPARGLLGFRSEFLTETRGTGILHSSSAGYKPWYGKISTRQNGALVADRSGAASAFSINRLQERGILFVHPGENVYEGMIVGENARIEDMNADLTRAKQQTNVRSSGADEAIKLVPPIRFSLEQSLEFIADDESIEVTPDAIRLRKVTLGASQRVKARKSGS